MESNEIINARISVIEARMATFEARLSEIEQGKVSKRKKKDLTPEDRAAIRARLVAGQQAKREREAAEAAAKAEKPTEVSSGDDPSGTRQKRPHRASG